jgi:hypothetical protein
MPWYFTRGILVIVFKSGPSSAQPLSIAIHAFYCSLQAYGAKVDQIKSEIGAVVNQTDIEEVLKTKKYKIITITHVDTSTGGRPAY